MRPAPLLLQTTENETQNCMQLYSMLIKMPLAVLVLT
jgi:hypothetical protein